MKRYNERGEEITILDTVLGRNLSEESMIRLISVNERIILEEGGLKGRTEDQARETINKHLDYYMDKHGYEYL